MIYQALDQILEHGMQSKQNHTRYFTSMHIGCSAPETMHLCKKNGYFMLSQFIYSQETKFIEVCCPGVKIEEVMPGIGKELVKSKFRESLPRIEYYVKPSKLGEQMGMSV